MSSVARACRNDTVLTRASRPLFLIGTRPELIKMAPILRALPPSITPLVCFTGQHTDLVDDLAPLLGVAPSDPSLRLSIMRPGQELAPLTARLLEALDDVLRRTAPDVVLGQGDTTTVLAGALAAFYRRVPFLHVEAGLRTHDLTAPFPEEANRRMAAVVTSLHFAPTSTAADHLRAEGVADERIRVVGNTVVDAVRAVADRLPPLASGRRLRVLVTTHRRESFGAPLASIIDAVSAIAALRPHVEILWPVHPNPVVRQAARALDVIPNVRCIEPLSYVEMIDAVRASTVVLTDSGGLQEEAPSLGVPVLVLRDSTERPEGIKAGVARLVGTDAARIVAETLALIDDPTARERMCTRANPYGDGRAAERIVRALADGFPSLFGAGGAAPVLNGDSVTAPTSAKRPAVEHNATASALHSAFVTS